VQHRLRVVRVAHLLAHAHDVAALLDEVVHVVVRALVRQLRHLDLLARELLVQVEQIQTGRWQVLHARQEHGRLQLGHRRLELRRDQPDRLVLHAEGLVEIDRLRHQIGVEIIKLRSEQGGEVLWNFITLLEAGA
jgi:hypothetical protein